MILTTLLAFVAPLSGGSSATYTAHPSFTSVDYTSSTVTSHVLQRFALYHPDTVEPAGGYPVVIHVSNSGLASTDPCYHEGIPGAPLYQFLDAGFAVIRGSLTFSDISTNGEECDTTPVGTITGNGLFHPPGVTLGGLSQPAYEDPARPIAETDVVMLVQHVRHNAAAMDLDPDRIAIYGRSGGAIISMWVALGPERNGLFGTPAVPAVDQDDESSKVAAAILRGGSVYFPAYVNTKPGVHLPKRATGPTWETPAGTLIAAVPGFAAAGSALDYQDPMDPFTNAMDQVYLAYGEPSVSSSFTAPYLTNTLVHTHSAWHGYAWQALYPSHTRLVLEREQAKVDLGGGTYAPYDALIEDKGSLQVDFVDYLVDELDVATVVESTGGGAPAMAGSGVLTTPVLLASGDFTAASPGRIGLSLAKPCADATLVVGFSESNSAFAGGILGPSPDIVAMPVETDDGGKLVLDGLVLSDGSTPVERWVQYWIDDDTGPAGTYTGSNTLHIDIP